jgi:hypothetical protein
VVHVAEPATICRWKHGSSVYHEVFEKSAENRPLINQPVAVGPAYTEINRLGAG